MQDSSSGGGSGGGGTNELTRTSGLARFRSAPATWLEALLEDSDDSLKLSAPLHQPGLGLGFTQLLTSTTNTNSIGPSSSPVPSTQQQQQSYNNTTTTTTTTTTSQPDHNNSYFESGSHHHHHQQNTNTVAFQRMNSSPAEFLSANIEGYFSSFGGYDFEGGGGGGPSSSKRLRDNNDTADFSSLRRGEQSGQLSTANSLVELEMEKLLEDSVPCRVRAKRGCATHPRSIAERVRRTRISDRIRKLQELVPNMDKQTNTADMLEEAVEYVKTLQRQIHELTEQQKKCKCIAKT